MVEAIAEAIRLPIIREFLQHYHENRSRIERLAAGRTSKAPRIGTALAAAFEQLLPQVQSSILDMVLHLAQSTLDTAIGDARLAVERVQEELEEGVLGGETNERISERIGQIFSDPDRARRIAVTETARVMHAGQLSAAIESGVVTGMRWLASSDACPRCEKLDGVVVPLGKPFDITGTGPYSRTFHPPLHPHCMCTITEEIR